jgi:murein DD-endopeptidase MepM/ murein hydrolase activator NlpD
MQRIAALFLAAAAAAAQTYTPRQGDAIRITAPAAAVSARMNGRTVRLFPEASGGNFGLMPVPVREKPGQYRLELLDHSGAVVERAAVTVRSARFRKQNIVLGKATKGLEYSPGELETMREFRKSLTEIRHWDEPFVVPVPGCVTSPFGVLRYHNGKPTGGFHGGLDQHGTEGQPVRAIASGVVKVVRMWNIHGGTVGIDHGQGLTSNYLHLSKFETTEGAQVNKGDVIGYVGSTGRSTAPHLHWGLTAHGVSINPLQWVQAAPCASATAKKKSRTRR